jgi:DNA-binding transcriptional ArsR family regulator
MSVVELIASPVRLRLLRAVADSGPARLPELARAAGVHRNTARPHLVELERAGAVVRSISRAGGRGRPAVLYRLAEGWVVADDVATPLAGLLSGLVSRLAPRPSEVQQFGREWGRSVAGGRRDPATVSRSLERLGFEVEVRRGEVRLRGCPCPLVNPGDPEQVCRLVGAVADGVLSGSDEQRVVGTRHDPRRRSCSLLVSD